MDKRSASNGYEPLDLSSLCNGGGDLIAPRAEFPQGLLQLRGLPFHIGSAKPEDPALLYFGPDGYREHVVIPIQCKA
nr:hypothetical protein [bacterium]